MHYQSQHCAPSNQQQQQQQIPTAPRVVVVGAHLCFPQQTVLVMQEQLGAHRSDNFTVTDTNGRTFFSLAAAPMSMRGKRQLLDCYNQPLLQLEQKPISLHNTWLMLQASTGRVLAEVKPSLSSLTPCIKVFLNDGDKEPDFIIQGDFRGKAFAIIQKLHGRGDMQIASVKKESKFANATAFLMSALTDAQKYFVTIEPGVDTAFVVALALLCDEVFNDAPRGGAF